MKVSYESGSVCPFVRLFICSSIRSQRKISELVYQFLLFIYMRLEKLRSRIFEKKSRGVKRSKKVQKIPNSEVLRVFAKILSYVLFYLNMKILMFF